MELFATVVFGLTFYACLASEVVLVGKLFAFGNYNLNAFGR